MGSDDVNYGRVEMLVNDTWLAICDKGFDDSAARVVCKEFGYVDGKKQCCSAVGELAKEKIGVGNVRCKGTEARIDQCGYTLGTCDRGHYVSVYCSQEKIVENGK